MKVIYLDLMIGGWLCIILIDLTEILLSLESFSLNNVTFRVSLHSFFVLILSVLGIWIAGIQTVKVHVFLKKMITSLPVYYKKLCFYFGSFLLIGKIVIHFANQ